MKCKHLVEATTYQSRISLQYCIIEGESRKLQTTPAICRSCPNKEEALKETRDYTKLRY